MKFLGAKRETIAAVAIALLIAAVMAFVAAFFRNEAQQARYLIRLNELAAPSGGSATHGRRDRRNQVILSFDRQRKRLTDADLASVMKIARAARDQESWDGIRLGLFGQDITDEGLRELGTLDVDLKALDVVNTLVTETAVIRLRRQRPTWQVHWRPPDPRNE